MSDIAVSVRGIGKRYRIIHDRAPYARLTETLSNRIRHPLRRGSEAEEFWALRDVSFEVRRGDVVGIIGRNGAGKSTLLKILSRITEPTEGEAVLHGRVSSLLEVGTGFHSELTGRENIFLSGSILGMRRSDIRRRFDEIVAFAEVERFLDTPVKRYSSGMQVRLGFAVAAHLEPDILVVDEVLAVGDAAFQKKCLAKMEDVARGGRTVLFVSHDLGAVASLTRSCVYLESGLVKSFGPTQDVARLYQRDGLPTAEGRKRDLSFYRRSHTSGTPARMASIEWRSAGSRSLFADLGSPLVVDLTIEVLSPVEALAVTAVIKNEDGLRVAVLYSPDAGFTLTADPGLVPVTLSSKDISLAPGRYSLDVGVTQGPGTVAHDVILDYPLVEIRNSGQVLQWADRPWGVLHPESAEWKIRR